MTDLLGRHRPTATVRAMTPWPNPEGPPIRTLTAAPGCPYCDTWRCPLIGPVRDVIDLDQGVIAGPSFLPDGVANALGLVDREPRTQTCYVRECVDCGHAWNEAID